jgi:TPR repeat protein
MLAEGRGIAQDLQAARACYLRAAAEGNGDAAVAAGEMLVNGRGGPPDRPAAMALFGTAATQGHKGAQYALQVLEPTDGAGVSGGACVAA